MDGYLMRNGRFLVGIMFSLFPFVCHSNWAQSVTTNQTPASDEFHGYYNIPAPVLDDLGVSAPVMMTREDIQAISTEELAEFVRLFPGEFGNSSKRDNAFQVKLHICRCDRTAIAELPNIEHLTPDMCAHLQGFLKQRFPLWRILIGMYSKEHTVVIYPTQVTLPSKFKGREAAFWPEARKSEVTARDNHIDSVVDRQHKLVEHLAGEKLSVLGEDFSFFVLAAFKREYGEESRIVCYVVADKRFTKTIDAEFEPTIAHPAEGYRGRGYDWIVSNEFTLLPSGRAKDSAEYRARIVEAYYDAPTFQNRCAIHDPKTHKISWIKADVPIWTPNDVRNELDKRIFGASPIEKPK